MSKEQPKPVPRKPRIRTKSEAESQVSDVHGGFEQAFKKMDIGASDAKSEMQSLSKNIAELRQEEQRLRDAVSQLQHQKLTLQEETKQRGHGWMEDTIKQKERELAERENEFHLYQERFRSEISDKEFTLRNRDLELQRLEDELNGRKKEMALARFDEEHEGVSSAQLAKLADKEIQLQKQEERLQQKEYDLNQWALRLDQQSKEMQQRLIEVQQREANAPVTATFPGSSHTQPYLQPPPQWGGEAPRPHIYTSSVPNMTNYYQGQEQPPPGIQVEGYLQPNHQWYPSDRTSAYSAFTANQGTGILGPNPASHGAGILGPNPVSQGAGILGPNPAGYQHTHQQQHQPLKLQLPTHQYQSPQLYQHQQSPHSSPEGAGMTHTSQNQLPGMQSTGTGSSVNQVHPGSPLAPSLNAPGAESRSQSAERILFSVGGEEGSVRTIRASSASMASAVSSDNYPSGREDGGTTGRTPAYSKTIDENEEQARAFQWEEEKKFKHQEDCDLELARRLQEEFDAEARSTQQHADSTDQLLAWQLQHEDLKGEFGSGIAQHNQLVGDGEGTQVTEVVKKVLDERMTRQHQIKEQEEADRRIAEDISANDIGDPAVQTNLRNNLSS